MRPTPATYAWTFLALLGLSCLTLGLSFLSLGWLGPVAAMSIAATKSVLVALFFMHLVEQRPVNALAFAVPVVLIALFVGIAAGEVATRETASLDLPALEAAP